MGTSKVSGTVKLTYYDEVIKNTSPRTEVYYDCAGQSVIILPGQSGTVRKVRRELVVDAPETPVTKDPENGEEQKQPEGKNQKGHGKS